MGNYQKKAGQRFEQLVKILARLRSKEGCPWDRQQSEETIINYLLEEVYEAIDAAKRGDSETLKEELGDVLMEVVFLAQINTEQDKFNISDSLAKIIEKMIRRHPHVFDEKKLSNSKEVIEEWEKIKKKEKNSRSIFDGLSSISPSLLQAFQIGCRASKKGFDWEKAEEALQKVKEEIKELEKAIRKKKGKEIEEEIGDLFFSLANISRLLNINPELALRKTNQKFINRFQYIEKKLKKEGKDFSNINLTQMDEIWEESKKIKL
ncbi:MAG: nucleoside triphosphate pyrophosphohydrolase [Candidatus Aminicenantia bacterium]